MSSSPSRPAAAAWVIPLRSWAGSDFFVLILSGLSAGAALNDPEASFLQSVQISSFYLPGRILALIMLGIAHLIFGLHFLLMLLRIGQPGGEPTLFAPIGEEEKH